MYLSIIKSLTTAVLVTLLFGNTLGQGCSDAGFCTIESFQPHEDNDESKEYKNHIKLGVSYGDADHSIYIIGNYLEFGRQTGEKLGIDFKLTSISQNGNGISTLGLSDLYLNANYAVTNTLTLTLGSKVPVSKSNAVKDNLPLPMDYQSTLGTLDLIVGIGYTINKLQLVLALQQPLTQNKNEFISDDYPANSELSNFQSTNKFKRNGDVLLRISHPVTIAKMLTITPSILPVYHLGVDKYTDASGTEQEIKGSDGLTLNGNAYFDFALNDKNSIQLNFGLPFIVRDVRPDGLTRSFIATLEYRYSF
ncbi:MAG: hypothetical protein JW894_13915 [Bacteroidales bacterium]|nr:hypothetical protein [Bacteroidales bacterium]